MGENLAGIIKQRQSMHQQLRENQLRISNLEEQIRATQKMATLGTMACLVAHEFNNILAPMINYSELALQNQDDVDLMRKALTKTIEHGNRAAVVIQSMLGVVRDQGHDRKSVLLLKIVNESLACLGRDLSKDQINVIRDIPDDLMVQVIPSQFLQVFLNLFVNARQAMSETGGKLTVQANSDSNNWIVINVSDTGCGIQADMVDKIFEPFVSTKTQATQPDQKGTGLGLMVCKDIIEKHDGTIDVNSDPGAGTTFTIRLPLEVIS